MPYAKTNDEVTAVRETIRIREREADGRRMRPTTRADRAQARTDEGGETEDQRMRTALAQPHRRGLPPTRRTDEGRQVEVQARDPLAGFVLGRMFLHGAISRDQLAAGQRYATIAIRHGRVVTGLLPTFPSQAISDAPKGEDCSAEMSDDEIFKLRRDFNDAQTALADTNEWHACGSALMSVCVMDRECRTEAEMGALRVGLNALHRLWSR